MSEMQFIREGVVYETLCFVPYDGFVTSSDISEKMNITVSLASARLGLLASNNAVRRKKLKGRSYYTRSKTLEAPTEEEAPMSENEAVTNQSIRPAVAAYLRDNIGTALQLSDIISGADGVTEGDVGEVKKMMHHLKALNHVSESDDGIFTPLASINDYSPRKIKGKRSASKRSKPTFDSIGDAIKALEEERDTYRAALELIGETVADALNKH